MLRIASFALVLCACSTKSTNDTTAGTGGTEDAATGGSAGLGTGGAGGGGTGGITDAGGDSASSDAGEDVGSDAAGRCTDLTTTMNDFDPCTNNCLSSGTCAETPTCGSTTKCSFFGIDPAGTEYVIPFKNVCAGELTLTHSNGTTSAQLEIYGIDPETSQLGVLKTVLSDPCPSSQPKAFTLPAPATEAILKVPLGVTVYLDDLMLEK